MSSGTKVYDSVNQPARFNAVLEAITKTEKIMFLCGPEVSVASGIPALTENFMFSSNAFTSQMSLRKMIADCSAHDHDSSQLADDRLAAYNKVMASRRIQTRSAPANAFYRYFHRVFSQKRVVKYLTTSFDGLEVLKKRTAESKVVRMHGDNRFLRCRTPGCPGIKEKDTTAMDKSLLNGATLPCTHCTLEAKRPTNSRRPVSTPSSYHLRPSVQGSLGADMLPGGKLRGRVVAAATNADLLLIAGISLQSDEVMDLVREIAEAIHGRYGGVVYIGEQPARGCTTKYYVDFHLKVAVDEWAQQVLSVMDQLQNNNDSIEPATENDKSDIWFEIISNELESLVCQEEPEETGPHCYLCNITIEECLLKCKRCGDYLCHTGPYPPSQTAPCVVLQEFRDEANKPPIQDEIDCFSCFHCWNQLEEGAYPHSVRPAPWVAVRERGRPAPRMVMLIYFLDQFWPQAKHLRNHVAGKWMGRGWSAHVEPIRLETLPEQGAILPNFSWEENTYNLFIVYITHGISESKTFQISPSTSYPAQEYIDHTLTPVRNLVSRAKHSLAFFACCGYPFRAPQRVWDLQLWLNKSDTVDSIIGCLHEKLTPAFLVPFIGKLTTISADEILHPEDALGCWLSNDIAVSHTDLIYFRKASPPIMWLFSPFNSRPLGKELPHLLTACRCKRGQQVSNPNEEGRKVWRVTHNATDGKPLNEVEVKITCSLCRQMWILPSEHLTGEVYTYAGLYSAIVPFFAA